MAKTVTAMPTSDCATGTGSTSRMTAAKTMYPADAKMKNDCPSPASASALPCPKRCSRSAGVNEWRTANKFRSEAAPSSNESKSVPSMAIEPVIQKATALTETSRMATATAA